MPVVVVGYVRNGTTLLSKLLYQELGYCGGSNHQLILRNMEHRGVQSLSNQLLEERGGHWINPDKMAAFVATQPVNGDWNVSDGWVRRAEYTVSQMTKQSEDDRWFWKDTRLPVTIPVWHKLMPPETKYVVAYRRPDHAVISMHRHIRKAPVFQLADTVQKALYAWETSYNRLLAWMDENPDFNAVGVDYEEWFFSPDKLAEKLSNHLEVDVKANHMSSVFSPKVDSSYFNAPVNNEIYNTLRKKFF